MTKAPQPSQWPCPPEYRDDPNGWEGGFADTHCTRWARYCWEHGSEWMHRAWSIRWTTRPRQARRDPWIEHRWTRICTKERRLSREYDRAMPPLWRVRMAFWRSGMDLATWLEHAP